MNKVTQKDTIEKQWGNVDNIGFHPVVSFPTASKKRKEEKTGDMGLGNISGWLCKLATTGASLRTTVRAIKLQLSTFFLCSNSISY